MKRLLVSLLAASSLALLAGCATGPGYRYTTTSGGGAYYSGQSAYGNADTVIYGRSYASPWGFGPRWGYGYYGPGWGWGGVGFGATYTIYNHRRPYYRHAHSHHRGHRRSTSSSHASRPPAHHPRAPTHVRHRPHSSPPPVQPLRGADSRRHAAKPKRR